MPKRKIAVAMSDWLVDELDADAEARLVSRSALVEEAVAAYVTKSRRSHARTRYVAQARAAVDDMDAFAHEYAQDPEAQREPTALEKLRQLRGDRFEVGR